MKGNVWQANLNPEKWHSRIPFYGRVLGEAQVEVVGDSPAVTDQEIKYAHEGGLDYWIFLFQNQEDWREGKNNYGLVNYLASSNKDKLGFCLMILPAPAERWQRLGELLIELAKEPTYQAVDGRPLVYLLLWDTYGDPERWWGNLETGKKMIEALRRQFIQAGFKNPYLVDLSMTVELAVRYSSAMGIDAIGAYANWSTGTYQDLAAKNRQFWQDWNKTGMQMVPLVNAGWDPRPRYESEHAHIYGEVRDWAEQPSPKELADHLQAALEWVEEHPESCPARTVMIYAWNETDEGSWLVPTLAEGAARLEAIRRMRELREKGGK
jgi:hypothetical protein